MLFKSLLKTIFPSAMADASTPNFEYFEQTKNQQEEEQEKAIGQLNQALIEPEGEFHLSNIEGQFLNYLFGEPTTAHQESALSQYVFDKIDNLLKDNVPLVLASLPVMPNTIVSLMRELASDDFDTNVLLDAINREPSIATDVIKLANSSRYIRGDKVITDLKSAFMIMGKKGLVEGVIFNYIRQFSPSEKLYFKQFGDKIWQHSQQCAQLSLLLAIEKENLDISSTAYLVGLIRNIGLMVIYQLMVEAFSYVDPDSSPSALSFKRLMQQYALKLTHAIAINLQLPDEIISAIKVQLNAENDQQLLQQSTTHPLALISYDANASSELLCLNNGQLIDKNVVEMQLSKLSLGKELKRIIDNSGLFLLK